jgi:pyruvate ferredoxin oxidoreductase gamma subunit/2-oxoisovalerate ferredoxin oxidoreductase gamma subunit
MYEIRIHGLGGQGVVIMTNILASASFYAGWQVQAFPYFGPERTGSPVTGFIRLDKKPIKLKQQIYSPDLIIVLNDSLLEKIQIADGAKPNTQLLIFSQHDKKDIARLTKLPLNSITVCHTKNQADKSDNMFVLGLAAKKYDLADLNNCLKAVKDKMSDKNKTILANNLTAIKKGYEQGSTTA